jgi:hypothetical protein
MIHYVPIFGKENQTFVGPIKQEGLPYFAIVIVDGTATSQTNCGLNSFAVAVAPT